MTYKAIYPADLFADEPSSHRERIPIQVFMKYDWFMMINHDDQCTNKQMLGAQPLAREAGKT